MHRCPAMSIYLASCLQANASCGAPRVSCGWGGPCHCSRHPTQAAAALAGAGRLHVSGHGGRPGRGGQRLLRCAGLLAGDVGCAAGAAGPRRRRTARRGQHARGRAPAASGAAAARPGRGAHPACPPASALRPLLLPGVHVLARWCRRHALLLHGSIVSSTGKAELLCQMRTAPAGPAGSERRTLKHPRWR